MKKVKRIWSRILFNSLIFMPRLVFFGTPTYSLIVLKRLYETGFPLLAVVTKPAQPVGRNKELTITPVAEWAKAHSIRAFTPEVTGGKPWQYAHEAELTQDIVNLKPDILVVADYAQKIPVQLIAQIKAGGLNVHPSLLPKYRGPAPVPWAIVHGETETGVSIVTLAEEFDSGKIIAQEKETILSTDTTHTLLTRLFKKGAELLVTLLPEYTRQSNQQTEQLDNETMQQSFSYTPRLRREDGFIPWEFIKAALQGEEISQSTIQQFSNITIVKSFLDRKNTSFTPTPVAVLLDRAFRAFHPWPGIWTKVKLNQEEKRLKILSLHLQAISYKLQALVLDEVQLEGKQPIKGRDVTTFLKQLTA